MDQTKAGLTEEQWQVIEDLMERFDEDWEISFDGRNYSIRRKDDAQKRDHDLFALYWWYKDKFRVNRNITGLAYAVTYINGSNGIYQWDPTWRMPEEDRKYLKNGILFAANGTGDLVSDRQSGSKIEWASRLMDFVTSGKATQTLEFFLRLVETLSGGG